MRYLIDTHLLIWAMGSPERLPAGLAPLLEAPETTPLFSVASFWELLQKRLSQPSGFFVNLALLRRALLDAGWEELPILPAHVFGVAPMTRVVADPFDQILLSQANAEGVLLISADPQLRRLSGWVRWMPA